MLVNVWFFIIALFQITLLQLLRRGIFSPHVRELETVLDFGIRHGFRILATGFRILSFLSLFLDSGFLEMYSRFQSLLDSGSLELYSRFQNPGFRIPVVSGFQIPKSRIPDPLSCITDSKTQDSRFHKQKFPASRKPNSLQGGNYLVITGALCKVCLNVRNYNKPCFVHK